LLRRPIASVWLLEEPIAGRSAEVLVALELLPVTQR
jgi:hypothetical protein